MSYSIVYKENGSVKRVSLNVSHICEAIRIAKCMEYKHLAVRLSTSVGSLIIWQNVPYMTNEVLGLGGASVLADFRELKSAAL